MDEDAGSSPCVKRVFLCTVTKCNTQKLYLKFIIATVTQTVVVSPK